MLTYRRIAIALAMLMVLAFSSSTPAPARAATQLKVCGEVTVYVPATSLLAGAITIGGTPFIIAAGTTLDSSVEVGANLCFDLTLDLTGQITAASVTANVTSTLQICGVVSAYAAATSTTTGSLTIAGRTFVTAVGSSLPASVQAGADLCLSLTLNGFGQVTGGTAQANVSSTLEVCGQVTAFTAATVTTDGRITIGGTTHVIAAGTSLASSIRVDAYLKLRLTLDVFARVSDAAVLKVGVSLEDACGSTAGSDPTPTPKPDASPDPDADASPDPDADASPDADADASPDPDADASPDPDADASPDPDADASQGGDSLAGQPKTCEDEGTDAAAAAAEQSTPDSGGVLPDTASFGRAGQAALQVSLPLLLLVAGLVGRELVHRRQRLAERRVEDAPNAGGIGEA